MPPDWRLFHVRRSTGKRLFFEVPIRWSACIEKQTLDNQAIYVDIKIQKIWRKAIKLGLYLMPPIRQICLLLLDAEYAFVFI